MNQMWVLEWKDRDPICREHMASWHGQSQEHSVTSGGSATRRREGGTTSRRSGACSSLLLKQESWGKLQWLSSELSRASFLLWAFVDNLVTQIPSWKKAKLVCLAQGGILASHVSPPPVLREYCRWLALTGRPAPPWKGCFVVPGHRWHFLEAAPHNSRVWTFQTSAADRILERPCWTIQFIDEGTENRAAARFPGKVLVMGWIVPSPSSSMEVLTPRTSERELLCK